MKGNHGLKRKSNVDQNGSAYGPSKGKQNRTDENSKRSVTDVNVEGFAESRAVEIQALTEVVKNDGGNHMAFQKLPRHMRRRAMSHNIKRVPRRLHQAVKSELDKTKPPGKRPSRCYRRRPRNLLAEYERRKRKIGWLETHIWHAKRFKMVQRWNYKLAFHPNEKSIRACYRAVNKYCLMQDVSYESYIEIKGPRQMILENLSHLTSDKTGPTFAAKMTQSGTRQGKLTLYTYDGYPLGSIGQVTYLWRTNLDDGENKDEFRCSTLWICCHPSFFAQVLVEINKCFNITKNCDTLLATNNNNEGNKSEVSVVSLKDDLVKFRLYGPSSNLVLSETLQIADIECQDAQNEEIKIEKQELVTNTMLGSVALNKTEAETSKKSDMSQKDLDTNNIGNIEGSWWKDFYSSTANRTAFRDQADAWLQLRKCQSPAEAPSGCVLALTVRDPRLLLPPKKNKVLNVNNASVITTLPTELFTTGAGSSPLWNARIRDSVKSSKISEQKINEMKSQQLLPGCPLQLGDKESRIPVILIQRPGASSMNLASAHLGYSSGWDLLIPSGWAMAFWVALVYRGARVGGIREARSIALQAGSLCEPFDFPDSSAGEEQSQTEADSLQTRHDRRPPAKRPNYTKLGFQSPFMLDFNKLVNEWGEIKHLLFEKISNLSKSVDKSVVETTLGHFYVLRDRKCLRLLNSVLTDIRGCVKSKNRIYIKDKNHANILEKITATDTGREMIRQHCFALIPVLLSIHQRGVPAAFGHICLPSHEDLEKLDGDKDFSGPLEERHKDLEEPIRREERKIRLKLRRGKKRGKDHKNESNKAVSSILNECRKEDKREIDVTVADVNKNKMNTIRKSITDTKLLNHNSRAVCGFIKNGDFDLGKGHGSGLGFCSLISLLHLLQQQGDRRSRLVLIRNPTSFQYRFASLSVVMYHVKKLNHFHTERGRNVMNNKWQDKIPIPLYLIDSIPNINTILMQS